MAIEARCPKCGSNDIDHPRTYGADMKFLGCRPMCRTCGHEGPATSLEDLTRVWRVAK